MMRWLLPLCLLTPAAHAADLNLWQQVLDGGMGIVGVAGLSIVAVAVTIERLFHLRAHAIATPGLVEQATQLWRAGHFDQVAALVAADTSALGRVLTYLATYRQHGVAVLSAGAGDIASVELRQHQQKIQPLAMVATVAPIVGLLGTVIGMIEAFHVIAFSGAMGDPALLAGGISKALINTAAGLAVALPALALHHYFKGRLATYGLSLERQVNGVINEWFMAAGTPPQLAVLHGGHHAH